MKRARCVGRLRQIGEQVPDLRVLDAAGLHRPDRRGVRDRGRCRVRRRAGTGDPSTPVVLMAAVVSTTGPARPCGHNSARHPWFASPMASRGEPVGSRMMTRRLRFGRRWPWPRSACAAVSRRPGGRAGAGAVPRPARRASGDPVRAAADARSGGAAERGARRRHHARLAREPGVGYLRAVLAALEVPDESQLLVFSKSGIQRELTSPQQPAGALLQPVGGRRLHCRRPGPRGGRAGSRSRAPSSTRSIRAISDAPQFVRGNVCLTCHVSASTLDVPGPIAPQQPRRRRRPAACSGPGRR